MVTKWNMQFIIFVIIIFYPWYCPSCIFESQNKVKLVEQISNKFTCPLALLETFKYFAFHLNLSDMNLNGKLKLLHSWLIGVLFREQINIQWSYTNNEIINKETHCECEMSHCVHSTWSLDINLNVLCYAITVHNIGYELFEDKMQVVS